MHPPPPPPPPTHTQVHSTFIPLFFLMIYCIIFIFINIIKNYLLVVMI